MALERQLRWLRAYALVTYPFVCVPFLFLYFQGHGLDAGQYGEVLTAYYAAMFVAEVPTGVLADRIGPHRMLVVGPLMLALGFATLVFAPSYHGFLLGEALLGLGHSVLSGPPSVVLYEALRRADQQHRYLHEESRIHSLRLYGTGSSFLLGGLLVQFGGADGAGYGLAIAATCCGNLLAAWFALRVPAPDERTTPPPAAPPAEPQSGLLAGARAALRQRPVRWLLGYWLVLFALLRFPFHNYQPYLAAAGELEPLLANAVVVGLVFAVLNLFAAPLSAKVPALVARYGRRPLFWGMPLVLGASLLVMAFERLLAADGRGSRAFAWIGVTMFFVQQVPFAMHWSLVHEFVNHRIGSRARTTVLSTLSLLARACYALVNVLLFHLQAAAGMATALATAGVVGGIAATATLLLRPRGLLRATGSAGDEQDGR